MGGMIDASRIKTLENGETLHVKVRRPNCDRWFAGRYRLDERDKAIAEQDARGKTWCEANCG